MAVSLRLVRNFLMVIMAIIIVVVVSVFVSFHLRAQKLTEDILLQQARALFSELIITRRWVSGHGGVFIPVRPGVDPHPFLVSQPGLKVNIKDQDGKQYTLQNPGLVVRGISELAEKTGQFRFHVASLKPINKKTNSPDAFEKKSLLEFEQGTEETHDIVQTDQGLIYRYMAPLLYENRCNKCHAFQGYKNGDIRGGIAITIPMDHVQEKLDNNRRYTVLSALGVLGLLAVAFLLQSSKFMRKLDDAHAQLLKMATTDGLTALANRKTALDRLEEEVAKHSRFTAPLSCILMDLDFFKNINDTYGHQAGDAVLKATAGILQRYSRRYDVVSRYGGEEFLLILPETDLKTAEIVAEKMRGKIERMTSNVNGYSIDVTASFGVAQMPLTVPEGVDALIGRADDALYMSKNLGRNRVTVAEMDLV